MVSNALMEIEFVPGTWTDVTAYVRPGVTCAFGTSTWDDDGQPGQINFTLENYDGRFTPDNPLSPYWDNIVEGVRVRYSIVRNGTTYQRGIYNVKSWTLNTDDMATFSTVTVNAFDRLASLSRRTMDSDYVERYRYNARAFGAVWMDAWPLIQSGHPVRPHNVGFPERNAATLVDPKNGRGASTYADPTPLTLEGSISLSPNTFLGPVVLFPTQATTSDPMMSAAFWIKIPKGNQAPLDDFAVLMAGWNSRNQCVFRICVSNTAGTNLQLEVHYGIDPDTNVGSVFVLDSAPNDNAWHSFYIQDNSDGVNAGLFYDSETSGARSVALGFLITDAVNLVAGGEMKPKSPGGQNSRSIPMWVAGVMASAQRAGGIEKYARGDTLTTSSVRFLSDYRNWGQFTGAYLGATGTRPVAIVSTAGAAITDAIQQLARTIAGMCWVRYTDDVVEMIDGTNMRPRATAVTLTVGEDDDVEPGQIWRRGAIENPTRQEVQSPMGDGTFVDTTAELRERRDGSSISAATVNPAASRALAAWYVRRGKRLRLSQFGIDVTSAKADLWNYVLTGIRPGNRIRLQNLDPTQIGYTYREVFLLGWEETWGELENGEQSVRIVFDTVPADTPAETAVEDDYWGRFDFDLQGASIGALTAGATSMTITTTGPALTTAAGDYPMYLNVDGETVQATAPPASGTSPQTVTIVRGVLGSVARTHPAGTFVQVHPMAGYGAG